MRHNRLIKVEQNKKEARSAGKSASDRFKFFNEVILAQFPG